MTRTIELEKAFNPSRFEGRWYDHWIRLGLFPAHPDTDRPPFSMVIPPPNVTGRLHMGHALNNTLQDILARWKRMEGDDVLWVPGTDHAGIATQMVVDRALQKEGSSREIIGRAAFVERIWNWKEEYGGAIIEQLKQLGCSCDWSRERFTLEPLLSRAVREAFVRLHEEGLIYRDKYIVNWCPRCRTAISDLEVLPQLIHGQLYTIAYPYADGFGAVHVATTRPETMLGDTGVAVHPDDERFRDAVGREVILPLVGRRIPIVADSFVEKEFGTGAVKITPAHDPNDYAASRRTGLPSLVVMDDQGRMNDNVPQAYRGLDRFDARARIVADLESGGHLIDTKDHDHNVGHCQRCGTIAEPYLSTQWFVRVKPLAEAAVRAVEDGRVRFIPGHWVNSYNEWMGKIHDWCISRQLWWGHQIPAWHCDDCSHITVAREEPDACAECSSSSLHQDPDVLDTWFSSALWPFSTLGWPDRTPELERYYPTTVLVTGFDILFFWVARMLMLGIKFMGDVPFREVYITGLVRDAEKQKMSKTRGNVVDPLDLIERHGADALRFTMAAMATPGSDLPLSEERMAGYRAFSNKLWNAARFILMNLGDEGRSAAPLPLPDRGSLTLADRWILSRLSHVAGSVRRSLAEYRFDEMANGLYRFVWHEYCDWYVEMSKSSLAPGAPREEAARARAVLVHVLDSALRLLHPVMPFLTEELWQRLPHQGTSISLTPYPGETPAHHDQAAEQEVALLMEIVTRIRSIRAELNIDPGKRLHLLYLPHDDSARATLANNHDAVESLARLDGIEEVRTIEGRGPVARAVATGLEFGIPLEGILDLSAERARLRREIDKLTHDREGHARKLSNSNFVSKARPEIVDKSRRIHTELDEKIGRLGRTLESLS
ncbi:MAG: valine--tRNA ligase [Acidobacteria bacterium]|nr:valine--tRNA ligase [Acidobacteriota bacterium]